MPPFFSVVIPLYNKEDYIEHTLKSVLNQSFKDFEIVIVDDGSTDYSFNKALKFKNSQVTLIKQENSGVSIARNNGIELAKSKYIALIDGDDIWYSDHLLELKRQIERFPNAGLYCNNYEVFYKKGISRKAEFNMPLSNDIFIVTDFFKASITNLVAWTSAVAFEKQKFYDIGKFDPYLKTAQDLDLWIRFALNYEVSFNPKITMTYNRFIENSLSKNEKEYNNIRLRFLTKYQEEEKTNPSLKLYLDINRYSFAIRCLLNNQYDLHEKFKKDIDYKNINLKQKILLSLPKFILKQANQFHQFLVKNNIYVTAYD
ncbi:glycosyltransferase family 2 protein [Seonamhaeicola maritimus]|uniref:glycosyltransferase family 2 protein n=1 Tax=Seonamhaeicola maritimus TaxID=2591822 RepID=UPI0024940629|nr:glycosyltransferase family 2 protein [Seonamhaeicola maritimus]